MSNHAVILVRLSQKPKDDEEERGSGLERQEADCRAYCERLGLTVQGAPFREVQSAYRKRARPVLERALQEAKGGHLVVWKLDRLTRRGLSGLAQILERLEADRTTLHSVTETIDASTPNGRMMLGILAGIAEQSSYDSSIRIRRALEENAKRGDRHGGGKGAFGWGEGEAELVREAAAWVTAGGSLRSLAEEWNGRGLKTSAGNEWSASTLSRLLRSETLLGVRTHKGERYESQWDSILTEAEFSALSAALRKNKNTPKGEATLLGRILVCGACGSRMRSASANKKGGKLRYLCVNTPGRRGCGKVSILREIADKEASTQVEATWDIWESAAPAPVVEITQVIARERESLAQLTHDHYVSRIIPRELFLPSYQELSDKIKELESQDLGKVDLTQATTVEAKIKQAVSKVEVFPVSSGLTRVKVHFRFGWLNQRALGLEDK